jgi:hypothetical protein
MQPAERDFGYMAGAISDWVHANTVQTIRATNLATALLGPVTANHSLGKMPGPGRVAAKEIYAALDGPGCEQPFIEANWSAATSRTAHCCCTMSPPPISKDAVAKWRSMATAATTVVTGRRVVIGLTATADGRPVAVEVFEGNTAVPVTLSWAFSPRAYPVTRCRDGATWPSLPATQSDAAATARAYKSLSGVEHAFRSLKCRVGFWRS